MPNQLQATAADIEIIYDVCWMLSPSQIQRMCTNYFVADYEVSEAVPVFTDTPAYKCDLSCRTLSLPKY